MYVLFYVDVRHFHKVHSILKIILFSRLKKVNLWRNSHWLLYVLLIVQKLNIRIETNGWKIKVEK